MSTYPEVHSLLQDACREALANVVWTTRYKQGKEQFLRVRRKLRKEGHMISDTERKTMVDGILSFNNIPDKPTEGPAGVRTNTTATGLRSWIYNTTKSTLSVVTGGRFGNSDRDVDVADDHDTGPSMNEPEFLASLGEIVSRKPFLMEPITGLIAAACDSMRITILKGEKDFLPKLDTAFTRLVKAQAVQAFNEELEQVFVLYRSQMISALKRPTPNRLV
jgi:hypothetical protein